MNCLEDQLVLVLFFLLQNTQIKTDELMVVINPVYDGTIVN